MHGVVHNMPCRLRHLVIFVPNIGWMHSEQIEQLFAMFSGIGTRIKTASAANWRDAISELVFAVNRRKLNDAPHQLSSELRSSLARVVTTEFKAASTWMQARSVAALDTPICTWDSPTATGLVNSWFLELHRDACSPPPASGTSEEDLALKAAFVAAEAVDEAQQIAQENAWYRRKSAAGRAALPIQQQERFARIPSKADDDALVQQREVAADAAYEKLTTPALIDRFAAAEGDKVFANDAFCSTIELLLAALSEYSLHTRAIDAAAITSIQRTSLRKVRAALMLKISQRLSQLSELQQQCSESLKSITLPKSLTREDNTEAVDTMLAHLMAAVQASNVPDAVAAAVRGATMRVKLDAVFAYARNMRSREQVANLGVEFNNVYTFWISRSARLARRLESIAADVDSLSTWSPAQVRLLSCVFITIYVNAGHVHVHVFVIYCRVIYCR